MKLDMVYLELHALASLTKKIDLVEEMRQLYSTPPLTSKSVGFFRSRTDLRRVFLLFLGRAQFNLNIVLARFEPSLHV
jgi:hypothetical protein